MNPKISVITPTYNEAKYIGNCLKSLQDQTLSPKEIIVVDDGSTDSSVKGTTLNTHKKGSTLSIKVFRQVHLGAGAARNLGAKHAVGDILVFVDADMEFDQDFLKNLTAPIRLEKTKGTFSKQEFVKNWHNPWARAWSHCLGLKDNRLLPASYPSIAPVFRAILKSEFDRAGGFDAHRGYDDDWSLSEKLGYQATAASDAVYYHSNPDSLIEIFHQARWRASRKYKFGLLGKLITSVKTNLLLFWPLTLNPHFVFAKIAFIAGTQIGLFTPRVSK
ncbi:MAG: glycosyltransferase family 2 protein [Candidatus Chisholmbacteria bacterium]|nr:glycosyltransferase family 2 protein [Candidatus Chisholmbacteria bacterium]